MGKVKKDQRLANPSIDWQLMASSAEPWWSEFVENYEHVEKRLRTFCQWLERRPEKNIAIVCHFNIIKRLIGRGAPRMINNCVPLACAVHGRSFSLLADAGIPTGGYTVDKAASRCLTADADTKNALVPSDKESTAPQSTLTPVPSAGRRWGRKPKEEQHRHAEPEGQGS
eukprot:TRINITY_DN17910_c0_g1_i4.p2 TRINITY_DN17910_c0_g1~~TRINITY_DN17910_c0_g1_i4.p2  ORF type:complete len:170 (-),score=33.57 TRINITY_DN17910_c0_g1_i4:473-982(-)